MKQFQTLKLPAEIPYWDRPLAIKGLISYRCRGSYPDRWIMIGAKDDADAFNEAKRSTPLAKRNTLQVWNGTAYVPVPRKRAGQ